jgi:hypothetical protein
MSEGINGTPHRVEAFPLPVSVVESEVETLQVEATYDRQDMLDPKRAAHVVEALRSDMIRQIAENLYDFMEFQDYESLETMRVHMRGRIQIIRRKDE